MEAADLALRSAAIGVIGLLGALMLRQWRDRPVGWLGAALCLGAVCHLVCPWALGAWGASLLSLPLLVGCTSVPLLFRWFARALFEERFAWRMSDVLLAAAVLGFGLAEIHLAFGGPRLDADVRMLVGFAAKLAARGFDRSETSYRVDAHYAAQVWDIAVELPAPRIDSDRLESALVEAFHASHRRIFSVEDRASPIEFLNWSGRLSVQLPQATITASGGHGDAAWGRRAVLFDLGDRRDADVVRGDSLRVGQAVTGPAIIEEATTTLVLPPDSRATLTGSDSYVVELGI